MFQLFEELGEPSKRLILAALRGGPRNVTQIVSETGLKQPNASNHLAHLRGRGLVSNSKVGREVFYALASPVVVEALAIALADIGEPIEFNMPRELALPFAEAAADGEEGFCARIVENLTRRSVSILDAYTEVFEPAMRHIGSWYSGRFIDEGHEHIASEITLRMMARFSQRNPISRPDARRAVVGCAEGTWHTIAPRMAADLLSSAGWRVAFVGASLPAGALIRSIREHQPDLVTLGCSTVDSASALLGGSSHIADLQSSMGFDVAVGGHLGKTDQSAIRKAGFIWCDSVRRFAELFALPGSDFYREATAKFG